MRIVLGSDHAGFPLKDDLVTYLTGKNIEVIDVGPASAAVPESYVSYGAKTATVVANGEADLGIVICGSGIGISLAANRIEGIRCALCTNEYMADMARRHNDANMLALGARVLAPHYARVIVDAFLNGQLDRKSVV